MFTRTETVEVVRVLARSWSRLEIRTSGFGVPLNSPYSRRYMNERNRRRYYKDDMRRRATLKRALGRLIGAETIPQIDRRFFIVPFVHPDGAGSPYHGKLRFDLKLSNEEQKRLETICVDAAIAGEAAWRTEQPLRRSVSNRR